MLKSYKAIYENGYIRWLGEQPPNQSAKVIVTILEEETNQSNKNPSPNLAKRSTPGHLIGKAKIVGDIINPIIDEKDWECLK